MALDIYREEQRFHEGREALKLEHHISPQYTAPISLSAGIYESFCYYCRSSIKNFM